MQGPSNSRLRNRGCQLFETAKRERLFGFLPFPLVAPFGFSLPRLITYSFQVSCPTNLAPLPLTSAPHFAMDLDDELLGLAEGTSTKRKSKSSSSKSKSSKRKRPAQQE